MLVLRRGVTTQGAHLGRLRGMATQGARLGKLRSKLAQDVRPGMELDLAELSSCLRSYFKDPKYFGEGAPQPHVRQIGQRSTYVLSFSDPTCRRLVLRAHNRARHEFQLVSALHALSKRGSSSVPVAQPHVLHDDASVLGKPFYLSDFVEGRAFFDAAFTDAPDAVHVAGAVNPRMGSLSAKVSMAAPTDRVALQNALVDTAVALHSIDMEAVGLHAPPQDQLGGGGGLESLISMATQVYYASSDKALQDSRFASPMEQLLRWLPSALPAGDDELLCIVHGDLHAEHVLFDRLQPTVVAVGGWEHWSLGHPGADLAMLALPYVTPGTLSTKHQGCASSPSSHA